MGFPFDLADVEDRGRVGAIVTTTYAKSNGQVVRVTHTDLHHKPIEGS
jgi:hypothetical protein